VTPDLEEHYRKLARDLRKASRQIGFVEED